MLLTQLIMLNYPVALLHSYVIVDSLNLFLALYPLTVHCIEFLLTVSPLN